MSAHVDRSIIERLLDRARPAIRALRPYASARSLLAHSEEPRLLLDANESPWPPDIDGAASGAGFAVGVHRYPDPQPPSLIARLAELYGVAPEALLVGRGADDAIDCLIRAFCEAERDAILLCPPTYGVYETFARIQGAGVVHAPLRRDAGFTVDVSAILVALTPSVKLVFVCSPNNPTGTLVDARSIATLCRAIGDRALVVVDEAYVEFSSSEGCAACVRELPNLVVLRTLSKAWALAGARCGTAIADPAIIALLQKVRAPYPLAQPSIDRILAELTPAGRQRMERRVRAIIDERERVAAALAGCPAVVEIWPSRGNFLLARLHEPAALLASCRARGVVLRDRSAELNLAGCVRITIGSRTDNDRVIEAVRSLRAAP